MPSKPLFGSPVAVGISDAVMAMRNVVSAMAGLNGSKTAASASVQEALRMNMVFPSPTIGRSAFGELQGIQQQISGQTNRRDRLPIIAALPAACDISRRRASPIAAALLGYARWHRAPPSTNRQSAF